MNKTARHLLRGNGLPLHGNRRQQTPYKLF